MYLRIFRIFVVMVFFLVLAPKGYASNLAYRLTHNDQYALVLGVVEKTEQNKLVFRVTDVLAGEDVDKKIRISVNKFWLKEFGFKKGDKLVISLAKTGKTYTEKWGIFTVDSLNYATLKLSRRGYSMGEKDDAALQWYINSGSSENEFRFVGNKVFVVREGNKRLQIYPETNQARQVRREFVRAGKGKHIFLTVVGMFIFAAGVIFVLGRKKKRRRSRRRAAKNYVSYLNIIH